MRQGFLTPGGLSGLPKIFRIQKSLHYPQSRRGINSLSHSESRLKPTAKSHSIIINELSKKPGFWPRASALRLDT